MNRTKEAAIIAALVTLTIPEVTLAQSVFDSITSSAGNFSSNNLPLQSNYPPLDSAVTTATDAINSNSGSPDTGSYSPGSIFQVDDIYQDAKDSKPSFFKDLLGGPSGNRALHPTTLKVFDILGKAQKGLQTYKLGRSVFDAVKGKNPGGIVGGVRSILSLYGLIDPNAAVAAATIGTGQRVGSVLTATKNQKRLKNAALSEPETPNQWHVKSINNAALASMAAQSGADIVLGDEGQQRLQAEEEYSIASLDALDAVIQDSAQSAVQIRAIEASSQAQAKTSSEVAAGAQKAKSTQKAVKDLNTMASIQANLSSMQVSSLAALNDSSLRQLGATATIAGLHKSQLDKTTTIQIMTAMNTRQLGNINNAVQQAHTYAVQKDQDARKDRSITLSNLIVPRRVKKQPQNPAGVTVTQVGQP